MYTLTPEIEKTILIEDTNRYGHKRREYQARRLKIIHAFYPEWGITTFSDLLLALYGSPMSGDEISEQIKQRVGVEYTPRSVTREIIRAQGKIRPIKEAFGIAIKKGRVKWQYQAIAKLPQKQISSRLRMQILTRDRFKCVLCGGKDFLEIDHLIARCKGGTNEPKNLRTLCHECNVGKRVNEGENGVTGRWVKGER